MHMRKGFPKYINELSQRAAGHVNRADVFNHPDGGTLFQDANGKLHDITLHTKRVLSIEEAFNEVFTASWGNFLALPIAPVVFDYQPVDHPTRHDENGHGCFITSVQMHRHAVCVATVLQHAEAREQGRPYPTKSYDETMWASLVRESNVPPLLQLEAAIFHHAIKPLSEVLPYMEWIGGTDLHAGNQILNMTKALQLVRDGGDVQDNDLGFYLCDFSANSLEVGDMTRFSKEEIARLNVCKPVSPLSNIVEYYPSLKAAEIKLSKAASAESWMDVHFDYPETLIIPVFVPHLDFKSMHSTIYHIQSIDDQTIRGEMKRLAHQMTKIIPDETITKRLNAYASHVAGAFIMRRDILVSLLGTQLSHEANPHSHSHNPFEVFKDVIAEEVDGYRERRRLLSRTKRTAKRPVKRARKPKHDKNHD